MPNISLYELKSELLIASLWGNYQCKKCFNPEFKGYFNPSIDDYGRSMFAYLCSVTFGVHRLPGLDQYHGGEYTILDVGTVTEEDIYEACEDLRNMYAHIQKEIRNVASVKDGKVRLLRTVREFELKKSCFVSNTHSQEPEILWYTNVFTSFAHDNYLFSYGGSISFYYDTPIEDVIYYDALIQMPGDFCGYSASNTENEVLVLNRNIRGLLKLNESNFRYRDLNDDVRKHLLEISKLPHIREKRKSVFYPSVRFPCQCSDFLTKFVMKRNEKRLSGDKY